MPLAEVHLLVHVNALLNATAAVLLLVGWVLIKQRREAAHRAVMLTAFAVSTAFLACYLVYHYQVGSVRYEGPFRAVYLVILITHIVLAVTVPPLALASIYFGIRAYSTPHLQTETTGASGEGDPAAPQRARYRQLHRSLARITFPIWMYVSVTGVVVYVMLYHLPPVAGP